MPDQAERIVRLIEASRIPLATESAAQSGLSDLFTASGIEHEREVRLSDQDRIDFLIGRIGIEVKIGQSKRQVFRQLERYAASDRIDTLILVSSAPFPQDGFTLSGKRAIVANMAFGWM